jgi:hypothetical protein
MALSAAETSLATAALTTTPLLGALHAVARLTKVADPTSNRPILGTRKAFNTEDAEVAEETYRIAVMLPPSE